MFEQIAVSSDALIMIWSAIVRNKMPLKLTSIIGKMLDSFIKKVMAGHMENYNQAESIWFYENEIILTSFLESFDSETKRVDKGGTEVF